MVNPDNIMLIMFCTILASILLCMFVKYCTIRYKIFAEENEVKQIKKKNFEIIFKNIVNPINSDEEELNENNISVRELRNDDKV